MALKDLELNEVIIIPGFQGINSEGRITTLGRGGSDTSAVAIAAAIVKFVPSLIRSMHIIRITKG